MFVSQTSVSSCVLAWFVLPFPAFSPTNYDCCTYNMLGAVYRNMSLDRWNVIGYLAKLLPSLPSLLPLWTCVWVFILVCTVAPNTCYLASYLNFQLISPTKWYCLLWSLTFVRFSPYIPLFILFICIVSVLRTCSGLGFNAVTSEFLE